MQLGCLVLSEIWNVHFDQIVFTNLGWFKFFEGPTCMQNNFAKKITYKAVQLGMVQCG